MTDTERLIGLFRSGTTAELADAIAELTKRVGQRESERIYDRALKIYDRETEQQGETANASLTDADLNAMEFRADNSCPCDDDECRAGLNQVRHEDVPRLLAEVRRLRGLVADAADLVLVQARAAVDNGNRTPLTDMLTDIKKATTGMWVWEYAALAGEAICDVATASDLDELKKQIAESFPDHTWEEVERRGIRGTSILVGHGNGRYVDTGHWVYRRPANEGDVKTLADVLPVYGLDEDDIKAEHSCANRDGIDPESCLFNPAREARCVPPTTTHSRSTASSWAGAWTRLRKVGPRKPRSPRCPTSTTTPTPSIPTVSAARAT